MTATDKPVIDAFSPRAVARLAAGEVLRRMPDYSLGDGGTRYLNIGTINGWHRLPARFTPGRRVYAAGR